MIKRIWTIIFLLMLVFSLSQIIGCEKATDKTVKTDDKAVETTAGYGEPSKEEYPIYGAPGYEAHTEADDGK